MKKNFRIVARNFVGTRGGTYGCILEIDLRYPEELHDLHNDYLCAPEGINVNGVEKLMPLGDKKRYILHCEKLKLCQSLGLKVTKSHRGISLTQRDWLKPYIDLNTRLRAKAKKDFKKDFFKLMNDSVFGKTIENILKMRQIGWWR